MATLIKVAFPDEFNCRQATLQVKPGDTVGTIKAKLVMKYASKVEKPDEFDIIRGSQVWREDESISTIGKDASLSIRRKAPGSPKESASSPFVTTRTLASTVVLEEDSEPEPTEDPPPPPDD